MHRTVPVQPHITLPEREGECSLFDNSLLWWYKYPLVNTI